MKPSTSTDRIAITFFLGCSLFYAGNSLFGAEGPAVDQEVVALLKRLRSETIRDTVKRQAEELKSGSDAAKKDAVLFFRDLHARSVLLELLDSKDWVVKSAVVDYCLDVFELDDLPRLYRIATSVIPTGIRPRGQVIALREHFVEKISQRAAAILHVERNPLKEISKQAVYAWWIDALKQAKKKPDRRGAIVSALLRDIERDHSK